MNRQRGHADFTGVFILVGLAALIAAAAIGGALYLLYKWIAS